METGLTPLATMLALLVLTTAVATPALVSVASAQTDTDSDSTTCSQSVTHETFRTDAAIATVNETGEAASTVSNTQVRIDDVTGFVRLHATNPNGYCVAYTVEISPEIVSPADLGEVESNDESTTASWRAAQNLTSGDVYTRVQFTLAPGENTTFAPSSVRVESLSWTGEAKRTGQGILDFDGLPLIGGNEKLDQRTYTIEPTQNASRITVPLEHNGETVEEWQAKYTIDGRSQPVTQDASEPVYYSEASGSVTFHFSKGAVQDDASVTFTAEPTWYESARYSAESYWSGIQTGQDWLPITTGIGGAVPA